MTQRSAPISPASAASTRVLIADDELFFEHVAPPDHPECGPRLLAVRAGLERAVAEVVDGRGYTRLKVPDATDEQLARVHTAAHIEELGQLAGNSSFLDSDTFLSPGSVAAARRAAGSAVALVDALDAGESRVGFALPRPPGHHALADRVMGFCLFNNVAVAAAHARAKGRERVLVLDWDVHHGNGTEAIFYDDPSVLFMSLHQYPCYPGTGADADAGSRAGLGRNVNLPLPPGGGDALYAAAFERVVLPIVEQFAPDFALVSCGFDAHTRDPLAAMQLSSAAYGSMTRGLMSTLPASCPLGLVLEGGYDLQALTESSHAVALALFGEKPVPPRAAPGESLARDASDVLQQVEKVQRRFWRMS
jgi:acetoin utilization deacetylase AcuC-like enzyme